MVHPLHMKLEIILTETFQPIMRIFSMCAIAVFAEFFSGKIIHGLSVTASRLLRDKSKIER